MSGTVYRTGKIAFMALLFVGANVSIVSAQSSGTILGTVRDSTGAVVPDTTVMVRNIETGFARTLKTEANGSYRFPALPLGAYEIRAEQAGFRTELRSGVGLSVGQEAVVNFSLQVGAVEQAVEVTGEAPLVNTTSGSLGGMVDAQQVADLPLNGRNFVNLALLQPGVTEHAVRQSNLMSAGTWMSVGGAPNRSNLYLLDGAVMNTYNDTAAASIGGESLGVDAIREWRMVTSSASAEYGLRMGGQMVVVTKSGTNSIHGSLFEYLRNNVLDARNFFDYKTEAFEERLPPFRRNQFGGSLGGPVKRDKLFFFVNYESLRERLGVTTISDTIGTGCQGRVGDVITPEACLQLGSSEPVTISAFAAPLLALYPASNLSGNRVTYPFSEPVDEHYGMVRGDFNLSDTDSMFFRYTIDDANTLQSLEFPIFTRFGKSRGNYVTASETHAFGPALLGTFRFSFSRVSINSGPGPTVPIGPQYSFREGVPMGLITIPGVSTPGNYPPSISAPNVYSFGGDLYYSRGRHSLKFGTLINHIKAEVGNGWSLLGSMSFSSLASFLRGQAESFGASSYGFEDLQSTHRYKTLGFYLQDDIRVRSNLTFNLGLRYEFHTKVQQDAPGITGSIRDIQRDADFTPGEFFLNPSLKNFSPRFGFAWDVRGDGKTSLRGGFGLLYDVGAYIPQLSVSSSSGRFQGRPNSDVSSTQFPPEVLKITALPLQFPPEALGNGFYTWDYHLQNPHILTYHLTVERQLPFSMALSLGSTGSRGLNLPTTTGGNPRHHSEMRDGRFYWTGTEPRINPRLGQTRLMTNSLNSWYNSLEFSVTKRLTRGLQFQSVYTWSKLLDEKTNVTGPDGGGGASVTTAFLPRSLDKGPGEVMIAHNWRFNAIYRLPQTPGLTGIGGALLNGWWVSGILKAQTGYPFTVTTGGRDRSRSLGAGNLPDLVPGRWNHNIISGAAAGCPGVAAGQRLGTPDLYYDPCAFSLEPEGFLGNQGRNILTGPGKANLDFSLVKDFQLGFLGEGGKLEFRTEVFNLLNRANFGLPNRRNFSAPRSTVLATAGIISNTDTTSRQMQFAVKVIW